LLSLFLLVGLCVRPLAPILLLTPILFPFVDSLGIDKVHFGITIYDLEFGDRIFTHLFGINIYVANRYIIEKKDLFYRCFSFCYIIVLIVLVFVTYIQQIS